ncbi:hypothetical protein BH20VER1_BH20VER1_12480 [soil metagenome]
MYKLLLRALPVFALSVLAAVPAEAATLTVTTTADSGAGSLRQAIVDANNNFRDSDLIVFDLPGAAPHIIDLLTPLPPVATGNSIVNDRVGDEAITIRRSTAAGTPHFQLLSIVGLGVVSGLTFTNGSAANTPYGGAVYARQITFRRCTFSNSVASEYGGAVDAADVKFFDCTFANNQTSAGGGAVTFYGGGNELMNCTFRDNVVTGQLFGVGRGGAIHGNNNSELTIVNCTFSGNMSKTGNAGGLGGAIYTTGGVTVRNSTFNGNVSSGDGDSINASRATVVLANNIFRRSSALNQNLWQFESTVTSLGHNLSDDAAGGNSGTTPGGLLNATGDKRNTDPQLDPAGLGDNGGPTPTIALQATSPARNMGNDFNAPVTDQRGRFRRGVSDIGAFEFEGALPPPPTLRNISTRARVNTGDDVLIGGFIVTGTQPKKVIIRAVGPSLPIDAKLADPRLELYGPAGLIASNDNWEDAPNRQEIIDSTVPPSHALESAILMSLPANTTAYTAIVRGTGVALVEIYDLDETVNSELANISTRGVVQTGDNVMIGGFILGGPGLHKVIVRAIGPSLPVEGKLTDPTLEIYDRNGAVVASNDNWRSTQQAAIIASTVPPANDLEAAIVIDLPPAPHTAIVRGKDGNTGIALVEVFTLE